MVYQRKRATQTSGAIAIYVAWGNGFLSSPIVVDDKVVLADFTGKLQIFKLSATFELMGEWCRMAASHGCLSEIAQLHQESDLLASKTDLFCCQQNIS
jgi:hypothetical protein